MPGPHAAGLASGGNLVTSDGVHLYHATKPSVVAHNEAQLAAFKAEGYQEEYIPQNYPKVVHKEVKDAAAEKSEAKNGWTRSDPSDEAYPKTMSKTFRSADEEAGRKPVIGEPNLFRAPVLTQSQVSPESPAVVEAPAPFNRPESTPMADAGHPMVAPVANVVTVAPGVPLTDDQIAARRKALESIRPKGQ